jgi:hypothetical protein
MATPVVAGAFVVVLERRLSWDASGVFSFSRVVGTDAGLLRRSAQMAGIARGGGAAWWRVM